MLTRAAHDVKIPACFMDFCRGGRVRTCASRGCFRQQVRFPFFADLVALAGGLNPIPSRTRPLNSPAPMILSLKAWKSRSLPGLPRTEKLLDTMTDTKNPPRKRGGFFVCVRRHGRACSHHLAVRPRKSILTNFGRGADIVGIAGRAPGGGNNVLAVSAEHLRNQV
jgi:hypothetical protein